MLLNCRLIKTGYLLVEDTLQVKDYPAIFAAGDCASIRQYPDLPKAGVIAVRQSEVLWKNIKGFINEKDGSRLPATKEVLVNPINRPKRGVAYIWKCCTSSSSFLEIKKSNRSEVYE